MPETNARIKVCHDTAANFKTNNPTLLVGEWALETDTKKMKIGDGSTAYNALPYSTAEDSDEWRKPDDWIDIRSGALDNSVYFLVGHSADYATYPIFGVNATISSGTYDVYVDGIKQATTASGTNTILNWQTLDLISGYDVAYPSALRTHIVRVTPSDSSNTISAIKQAGISSLASGLLWAHFAISNAINLNGFSRDGGVSFCNVLEAITADGNILKIANSIQNFARSVSLKTVPVLDGNNQTIGVTGCFGGNENDSCVLIEKVHFKNIKGVGDNSFCYCANLKEFVCENSFFDLAENSFTRCVSLRRLPPLMFGPNYTGTESGFLSRCVKLKDTFIDASSGTSVKKIDFGGNSEYPLNGIKGLTVSNAAPFNHETGPQLDVSYTGLSRAALVNLFKSMPYNVGYTVVGSPTIVDGVLSKVNNDVQVKTDLQIPGDFNLLEFVTKIGTVWKSSSAYIPIISFGAINSQSYIFANAQDSRVILHLSEATGDTFKIDNFPFNKAQDGTGVYVKLLSQKNTSDYTYTLAYSLDKQNWTSKQFISSTMIGNKIINLLRNRVGSSGGDSWMDLNETYIKVNEVPWFTGKEAMTKTCSIVGATGTADLTQEDKNIILNKGWSLTVQ